MQKKTSSLLTKIVAGAIGASTLLGAGIASAAPYIDYWGDNLFLGLAYHRVGCYNDDVKTLSNQDYDGFTNTRYCFAGAAWDAPAAAGHTYLDWNNAPSLSVLNNCGTQTNNYFGTPNYAARSNTCSYNVLTNCNSDCWIERFSRCQGYEIATLSPCF
jgi:hypothetical protein